MKHKIPTKKKLTESRIFSVYNLYKKIKMTSFFKFILLHFSPNLKQSHIKIKTSTSLKVTIEVLGQF